MSPLTPEEAAPRVTQERLKGIGLSARMVDACEKAGAVVIVENTPTPQRGQRP
ncbi:MAG TPA: hypothetical protein HA263_00025 [Methanoregulaceae archaeon]|nr:hypothetical protein [Methanoregulaceae archaeon]